MNNKYKNQGLGQLGNMKQRMFDAPPEEYMTTRPENQTKYRQATPNMGGGTVPPVMSGGLADKEQRRMRWMQKRKNSRRGLENLNTGGQSWN